MAARAMVLWLCNFVNNIFLRNIVACGLCGGAYDITRISLMPRSGCIMPLLMLSVRRNVVPKAQFECMQRYSSKMSFVLMLCWKIFILASTIKLIPKIYICLAFNDSITTDSIFLEAFNIELFGSVWETSKSLLGEKKSFWNLFSVVMCQTHLAVQLSASLYVDSFHLRLSNVHFEIKGLDSNLGQLRVVADDVVCEFTSTERIPAAAYLLFKTSCDYYRGHYSMLPDPAVSNDIEISGCISKVSMISTQNTCIIKNLQFGRIESSYIGADICRDFQISIECFQSIGSVDFGLVEFDFVILSNIRVVFLVSQSLYQLRLGNWEITSSTPPQKYGSCHLRAYWSIMIGRWVSIVDDLFLRSDYNGQVVIGPGTLLFSDEKLPAISNRSIQTNEEYTTRLPTIQSSTTVAALSTLASSQPAASVLFLEVSELQFNFSRSIPRPSSWELTRLVSYGFLTVHHTLHLESMFDVMDGIDRSNKGHDSCDPCHEVD